MEQPFLDKRQKQEFLVNFFTQFLLVVVILMLFYETILLCQLLVYLHINNLVIRIDILPAIEP